MLTSDWLEPLFFRVVASINFLCSRQKEFGMGWVRFEQCILFVTQCFEETYVHPPNLKWINLIVHYWAMQFFLRASNARIEVDNCIFIGAADAL